MARSDGGAQGFDDGAVADEFVKVRGQWGEGGHG
jgi:hypothetical protein